MARGKRPATFRTRKLSLSAPMVLPRGRGGRVGRRRTTIPGTGPQPTGCGPRSAFRCLPTRPPTTRPAFADRVRASRTRHRTPWGSGADDGARPGRGTAGRSPAYDSPADASPNTAAWRDAGMRTVVVRIQPHGGPAETGFAAPMHRRTRAAARCQRPTPPLVPPALGEDADGGAEEGHADEARGRAGRTPGGRDPGRGRRGPRSAGRPATCP